MTWHIIIFIYLLAGLAFSISNLIAGVENPQENDAPSFEKFIVVWLLWVPFGLRILFKGVFK